MMMEAQTIAERLGLRLVLRSSGLMAPKKSAHKTSMLQDIETGRPTEVDAIVGAVAEPGRLDEYPNFILMRSMPASSYWKSTSKSVPGSAFV